jgi:hypothetical protein
LIGEINGWLQSIYGSKSSKYDRKTRRANNEGVKGLKAYGTFSQIDSDDKTTAKMYYEAMLFSQEGGLQQF